MPSWATSSQRASRGQSARICLVAESYNQPNHRSVRRSVTTATTARIVPEREIEKARLQLSAVWSSRRQHVVPLCPRERVEMPKLSPRRIEFVYLASLELIPKEKGCSFSALAEAGEHFPWMIYSVHKDGRVGGLPP